MSSAHSKISFVEAINQGIDFAMREKNNLVVIGEGVPDPKGIFSTTSGLQEKYGSERVFDMPLSENGMTGIAIGAAINNTPVLLIHQRIDFSILSMDQIINNAAKWHYMFNGEMNVPIVIRMIIGRGWGQGPQHSQNLQALFAHIPGLKVVTPASVLDAREMIYAALKDNDPVIFIEHRWLYNLEEPVPTDITLKRLNGAEIIKEGTDVTLVSNSLGVIECIKAAKILSRFNINVEIVDLRSIRPIDHATVSKSIAKTGRLIVVDFSCGSVGVASEVIAKTVSNNFNDLKTKPLAITLPEHPVPTSHFIANSYYFNEKDIVRIVSENFGIKIPEAAIEKYTKREFLDVPSSDYHGPF